MLHHSACTEQITFTVCAWAKPLAAAKAETNNNFFIKTPRKNQKGTNTIAPTTPTWDVPEGNVSIS